MELFLSLSLTKGSKILHQGLLFGLLKGGLKVSSGTVHGIEAVVVLTLICT